MMVRINFFRFLVILFAVGTLLAGCGSSVPDVTDEEIIALVGQTRGSFSRDNNAPLVIVEKTVECVEMLSGLNADIIKDMPAEMLGMMKTQCRQEFDKIVKDDARNTKGFKLEHFENKDFAKRIIAAAEKSEAIYNDYEIKRKEEEQAQRLREKEEELAAAQEEFEKSLENYETYADEFVSLCKQANAALEILRGKNRFASFSFASGDCGQTKEEILQVAQKNRDLWANVKIENIGHLGWFDYNTPYINDYGPGTVQGLERMIGSLKDDLDNFKRLLEQVE